LGKYATNNTVTSDKEQTSSSVREDPRRKHAILHD